MWQQRGSTSLDEAIVRAAPILDGFAVHAADISFRNGRAKIQRFDIPWKALREARRPLTLVIRVPHADGGLGNSPDHLNTVQEVIAELLSSARTEQVPCREVQIDYDCPESKLALYGEFFDKLHAIRRDLLVTFTALPSWLKSPSFTPLVQSTSRYVLQVHSLELPGTNSSSAVICDVAEARWAIEQAAKLGVPFRAALPTYSCVVILDAEGNRVDVVSEGNSGPLAPGLRGIRGQSDPTALSKLVAELNANHPSPLQGIIWYRLPVESDRMNWSWTTFQAVIAGRTPISSLEIAVAAQSDGSANVEIRNTGERSEPLPPSLTVHWGKGDYEAGDALGGYRLEVLPQACRFTRTGDTEIAPGKTFVAGWIRVGNSGDFQARTN